MKRNDREFLALLLANRAIQPFANGVISTDPNQYGAEVTTSDGTWTEVESVEIDLGTPAIIKQIEIELKVQVKSSGATKYMKYKLQGRNKGGTWTDISAEEMYAANASAYAKKTIKGLVTPVANFNQLPIELRFMIQREDAVEEAIAHVDSLTKVNIIIDPRTEVER